MLDVLPKNALEDLTAEDFRLLVNGCGEVNVQMLISFTSFNDESGMAVYSVVKMWHCTFLMHYIQQTRDFIFPTGENADKLLQFKRWFWSIVEKMSMTERQDLVSLRFFLHLNYKLETNFIFFCSSYCCPTLR